MNYKKKIEIKKSYKSNNVVCKKEYQTQLKKLKFKYNKKNIFFINIFSKFKIFKNIPLLWYETY